MGEIFLSTAAFCLWGITPEEKLNVCRQLGFESIEIALSTERMVRDFQRILDTPELFSGFRRVALHAPWHGVSYGNNKRSQRVLEGLRAIHDKVQAETVVFHSDCVADIKHLIQSNLPICLENSDRSGCWEKLKNAVEEENLPFALNINMATRKQNDLDPIIEQLGHRIARIHISGHDQQMGRTPIVHAGQLSNLERINHLTAPLVLEGLFQPGDTEAICNERRVVKNAMERLVVGSL